MDAIVTNTHDLNKAQKAFSNKHATGFVQSSRQQYYRQAHLEQQKISETRSRIMSNISEFDMLSPKSNMGATQSIYRNGAKILLNKIYKRPQVQTTKN